MYSRYKDKKYQIKKVKNPTGKHRRCIFHDDGEPAFIQTCCGAYECVIPVGDLKKAQEYLQNRFGLSTFIINQFAEGQNVFIYWEDSGSGSWQVINEERFKEKKNLTKTSCVIKELQRLIALHGDRELLTRDPDGILHNIRDVKVFSGSSGKFFKIVTTSVEELDNEGEVE